MTLFSEKHVWTPVHHPDGIDIHHFVNEHLREIHQAEDRVITGEVIKYLRNKGYAVLEPGTYETARECGWGARYNTCDYPPDECNNDVKTTYTVIEKKKGNK